MRMLSTTQSSNPPIGGSNGTWRYRLLHYHVPLALISVVLLFLFMTIPSFDPRGQPMMDTHSSSALPQMPGQDRMSGMSGMEGHSGNQTGHSGGQTPSLGHGGNQTPSAG